RGAPIGTAPAAPGTAALSASRNASLPPKAPAPIAGPIRRTSRISRCASGRSLELDDQTVADRHPAIHARGDLEIVGGDDGGKARRAHQLGERAERVLGGAHIEIAGRLGG